MVKSKEEAVVTFSSEDKDLQAKEVLLLLERHESECNIRYEAINEKLASQSETLKTLDMRMWGIAALIIATFLAEKLV
jgi:hypothetical protein|tara:strand:+ start:327 stop:560 length:234 start_codon:yes stop_codon:yes gene_type:complete